MRYFVLLAQEDSAFLFGSVEKMDADKRFADMKKMLMKGDRLIEAYVIREAEVKE
jgi:hypothetical protein